MKIQNSRFYIEKFSLIFDYDPKKIHKKEIKQFKKGFATECVKMVQIQNFKIDFCRIDIIRH